MNKVRSTVKHMPRKAKLLTALLACVLVITLIGVAVVAAAGIDITPQKSYMDNDLKLEFSRPEPKAEWDASYPAYKTLDGYQFEIWSYENKNLSGKVRAYPVSDSDFDANTGVLKITNKGSTKISLSFDYQISTTNYQTSTDNNVYELKIAGTTYNYAKNTYASGVIDPNDSIEIWLTAKGATVGGLDEPPHVNLEIKNITVNDVLGTELKLLAPENGTYIATKNGTGGGEPISVREGEEKTIHFDPAENETVTLTATHGDGYIFYMWEDRDGTPLSTKSEITVDGSKIATTSIRPVFVSNQMAGAPIYRIQGDSKLSGNYYYWDDAMNAALNGPEKNVVLLQTLSLDAAQKPGSAATNNTFEIPNGVTLVVPYSKKLSAGKEDAVNMGYDNKINPIAQTEYGFKEGYNGTDSAFRTLTVSENCTLNVNGTLLVNAVQGAINGAAYQSHVLGNYGHMEVAGTVNVNAGGTLYARGYVTGDGRISVKPNGIMYQMLQLVDWRGGNYSLPVASGNNYPTLPFSGYYLQNNMVRTTYSYGASMKARAVIAVCPSGQDPVAVGADVPVIANGDASNPSLFVMAEGASIETKYDKAKDQLKVTLNGNTSMNCLRLNVGSYSLTTEGKELAISDNIQVTVASGKMTIAGGLKFLPGAKLTVANGAELEIAEKGKAFFYARNDYKDEYTNGAWRNKLQADKVITDAANKVMPAENADLDLQGSLVINGTLALSKSHPGLTANDGASVTVNYNPVTSDLLLYEPYKELSGAAGKVPAAPDLGDGVVPCLVASDEAKGEADYVFENSGWTAPKGAMVDDGSIATLEKGTTYKAYDSKWYSHKITVTYNMADNSTAPAATPVYTTKNECTFTAPKGYVITDITTGNTGIETANADTADITPKSEGWRSVKLSNITAPEATLTATVKAYGRTVTWDCKTGDKTEQSYSYLPANATEATLTFNGIVQINEDEVKVNGTAPAANQITISEANGKTSVKVTGISADTRVTVPYSSSFTVTWKVKTNNGIAVSKTSQTEMNSATYALHNSDSTQNFWNVVEDAAIKLPTGSAAKVKERSNTDDITLTNVFGDTTVEIDITTYKHKVTTSTKVYKAADEKTDLAETIVTFVNKDTYTPKLTNIGTADKYVVSKYEINGGTLGSKPKADVCAILPKDVSIDLSGKDVVVSLELQSYLYVWNWDATLDNGKKSTPPGFTYTEYLTDRRTGDTCEGDFGIVHTYMQTLRDYGEKGRYYCTNDRFAGGYFSIDYRSLGNNRFTIIRDQENLPKYPGAAVSLKNGVLSAMSDGTFTLNDASVTVALVSYATKVTVKDGTNNGLPEGIFYANADGKDATSNEEIVYGAFRYDDLVEWEYCDKQLFVKGYTIGIDGTESTTPVNNVGALLGDRFTVDSRLNGLTISADTVKSAAGSGSGKDLTVTLTDLAKYYQVYAFSEDDGKSYSKLLFVQEQQNGKVKVYAPKLEDTYDVSCSYTQDTYYYHPQLTVKNGVSSFIQKTESTRDRSISSDGKTLKMNGEASSGVFTPKFSLTPYTKSLTWNVGNASGITYVTKDDKAYCGLNADKNEMLVDTRYSKGTWTYTVPTGQTVAPNGLTYKYCDAVYEGGKVTVSGLTAKSTVSITTSPETSTDADTYYMGDMSFEYVRNAAAFTWDGKAEGGGSWKPVNSFGWRHAVGSKSYEVGDETLTVDNGSILFVNTMKNTPVTYTVQLSKNGTTDYGVSLMFDESDKTINVNEDGVATVTVPANSRVTLVCRMTGTPKFNGASEINIGTITVTKN